MPMDDDTQVITQMDGAPARDTLSWVATDEIIIGRPFTLTIPPEIESGEYRVMISLYDSENGARLPVEGGLGGNLLELTRITVR